MSPVMGTAGHIDHGKTSLIRALTGHDCDRLAEEKRRGISIELGFAELLLPGGGRLSIVDVPGHERFVRTMVMGAAGIDCVLLVVAADEGVMPQTREHLDICELLGIRAGLVALSKSDAVDEAGLTRSMEDIRDFLKGTMLQEAPVIAVSSLTGQGMDSLKDALFSFASGFEPIRSRDLFRLPVDRVFSLRGHGTIVTGTQISGQISVGDTVEFSPCGLRSRVRCLQRHGADTEIAEAGRRTAINVPELRVEQLGKGETVCRPNSLFPSRRWVVQLRCLASSPRPLRHRAEAHFYHCSREMQARLYFADRDRLLPGESCLCEARFTEAAPAVFGDRFVIRAFSPLRTVAGGIVLNPLGVNMRRSDSGFAERCRMLSALIPASDAQRICIQLACTEGAQAGATFSRLRVLTNLEAKALEEALRSLSDKRLLCCVDKEQRVYMAEALMSGLCAACEDAVSAHHRRYPEKPGIKRGELASGWGKGLTPKLVQIVPARLLVQGRLVADGDYLRLPAHAPALNKEQALSREALLAAYTQAGLSPPNRNALIDTLKIPVKDAVLLFEALRASGQLVRVSEDLWYAAEHLAAAEAALRHCLLTRDSIDVAGFREATGLSRKYIVPLLEYFDLRKLTLRIGDKRILRQPLHPTRNEHGKSSPTPVPLQGCEDTSLQGECETL